MADKVTSLARLRAVLEENGADISMRQLKEAMDDGCPVKSAETGEYEPERVKEFLIARGIVKQDGDQNDSSADQSADENVDDEAPPVEEQRAPLGAEFCPSCASRNQKIRLQTSKSTEAFQYYKPCPECSFRLPPRVKPKIKELLENQRRRQQQEEPAVQRP